MLGLKPTSPGQVYAKLEIEPRASCVLHQISYFQFYFLSEIAVRSSHFLYLKKIFS